MNQMYTIIISYLRGYNSPPRLVMTYPFCEKDDLLKKIYNRSRKNFGSITKFISNNNFLEFFPIVAILPKNY